MSDSYWARFAAGRFGRRRAMAAGGASALGALLLAACGGGDDSGGTTSGPKDTSGLITNPEDSSKQAKRGGTIKFYATGDAPSLDPMTSAIQLNQVQHGVYARLTQLKAGYLAPRQFEIIPDMAQSWEWSADRLSLTMKLRPGVKFHNKPPVNGRLMDAEDVTSTWKRFSEKSPSRTTMSNAANPDAPVLSVTAIDNSTVQFKLKAPVVYLMAFLANNIPGYLAVLPKETDGSFDIRKDEIGTGPFYLANYTPSVGFTLKRNPDYYEKDFPLLDTVEMPIVSEYAQGVAQLKTGALYSYNVRLTDVVAVKKETPALQMYVTDPTVSEQKTAFGWLPAGKSPFIDERVRQAVSMSYDRNTWLDVFNNVSTLEKEGLPVETRWNSHLAMIDGWWIDPRNEKEFGANAKYFRYDVAEAKKLLAAAGHASGLEVVATFIGGTNYGTDYQRQIEVLQGMNAEAGIKFRNNVIDYQTEFLPRYRDARGQHEGLTYKQGPRPSEDPQARAEFDFYSKAGANFLGFDTTGQNTQAGDSKVDEIFDKARAEIDDKKRKALLFELQNYLAKTMYGIRWPGGTSGLALAWPALRNYQVYRGDNRSVHYSYWVDETLPPIKA